MAEMVGGAGTGGRRGGAAKAPASLQRPATASPRLQAAVASASYQNAPVSPGPHQQKRVSARAMLSYLDAVEAAAAAPVSMFPTSERSHNEAGPSGRQHKASQTAYKQRPKTAPLRVTGNPRLRDELIDIITRPKPEDAQPRVYGRASLYDHGTAEAAPHEVLGEPIGWVGAAAAQGGGRAVALVKLRRHAMLLRAGCGCGTGLTPPTAGHRAVPPLQPRTSSSPSTASPSTHSTLRPARPHHPEGPGAAKARLPTPPAGGLPPLRGGPGLEAAPHPAGAPQDEPSQHVSHMYLYAPRSHHHHHHHHLTAEPGCSHP